jgi:hypothetical protein
MLRRHAGTLSFPGSHFVCTMITMLQTDTNVTTHAMEQCAFNNVNNCLNTNIYSYLETSGGKRFNLYLNVVHFFNTSDNKTPVAA